MATVLAPREKMSAARLMFIKKWPYFSAALINFTPLWTKQVPTLGVTAKGTLAINEDFVARCEVDQLCGVLLHEVGHFVRNHAKRQLAMGADPSLFNLAGDCEINDDLVKITPLPDNGGALPSKFGFKDGLMAEEYYTLLRQEQEKQDGDGDGDGEGESDKGSGKPGKGKGKGQGQGGDSDGDEDGDGDGQGDGSGQGKPDPNAKGKGQGGGKPDKHGEHKCGGVSGNKLEHEDEIDKESGAGKSEAQQEAARKEVAIQILEASKSQGSVPEGWKRWAAQYHTTPKIPWQQKLAVIARKAVAFRPGQGDYHYNKPSRRQAGLGFGNGRPVLAAQRNPQPRVAVVVDTSGSMGDRQLSAILSECQGVLKAVGADVDFCVCDAEVHALKLVKNIQQMQGLLTGGGGTDFRPAFEALSRLKQKPEVVIFATDGYGTAPAVQPAWCKTIWLIIEGHKPCAWGDAVEIEASR